MKEIEVSAVFDASCADVEEALSPRSILEYEGTFEPLSTTETADGWNVVVTNEALEEDVEMSLEFTEIDGGFAYEQGESGLFDELYTEIVITENGGTTVTARSWFTFGGLFASVKDWFAVAPRRRELERFLLNLGRDLAEDDSSPDSVGSDVEDDPDSGGPDSESGRSTGSSDLQE